MRKNAESTKKVKRTGITEYVIHAVFTAVMAVSIAFLWNAVQIQADTNKAVEKSTKMQSEEELKKQIQGNEAELSEVSRTSETPQKLTVVLDPGHGGDQSGAARDGESVEEKTLNLKIARYLKEELETYENVTVYLTREDDSDVDLPDRTKVSVDKKADVMISLHNNAAGACAAYDHGCTVLAAKDGYKDALALEEQKLSCNILNELSKLGIENQSILLRDSEANEKYPNGALADYYAIIRGGVTNDIPTVLIEHAFIDNASDYAKYLSSDEKLSELAVADATGIARYYQLIKKSDSLTDSKENGNSLKRNADTSKENANASKNNADTSNNASASKNESENITGSEKKCQLEPLVNYREKLVHAIDGNAKHNKISYRTYYSENKTGKDGNSITGENSQEIEAFQKITDLLESNSWRDLKEFYRLETAGTAEQSEVNSSNVSKESNKMNKQSRMQDMGSDGDNSSQNDKKKEVGTMKIALAVCNIILLCCIVVAIKISRKNRIKIEERK